MRESPPPLSPDVALFLDFDGTLTELAITPDAVRVDDDLPALLQTTAWGLNGAVAIISGRRLPVIDHYIRGAIPAVAGISGAERRNAAGQLQRVAIDITILDPARVMLAHFAKAHPGVLIEDKESSLAVHYRMAPQYEMGCVSAVGRCAADSHGALEVISSNMVVELRPVGIRKAAAVLAFMNEAPFAGRRPVFIGDDAVDEDAFTEVNRTNGYSVVVGTRACTAATYRLDSVSALHDWLRAFAADVLIDAQTRQNRKPTRRATRPS